MQMLKKEKFLLSLCCPHSLGRAHLLGRGFLPAWRLAACSLSWLACTSEAQIFSSVSWTPFCVSALAAVPSLGVS